MISLIEKPWLAMSLWCRDRNKSADRISGIVLTLALSFPHCAAADVSANVSLVRPTDKWALVIGISKFKDAGIPPLKYASKDASDFGGYLINEANFSADHVKILTDSNANRQAILGAVSQWLRKRVLPDDLVVVYLSTHGSAPDDLVNGVNSIIASDTELDNVIGTGITMQDFSRMIKSLVHSDHVLILADACHSGTLDVAGKGLSRQSNMDLENLPTLPGQTVVSSSEKNQRSWESDKYHNSIFTRRLMEGLRKDGQETRLQDAFTYMKTKVAQDALNEHGELQTPVLKSAGSLWQNLALAMPPLEPRKVEQEPVEQARAEVATQPPPKAEPPREYIANAAAGSFPYKEAQAMRKRYFATSEFKNAQKLLNDGKLAEAKKAFVDLRAGYPIPVASLFSGLLEELTEHPNEAFNTYREGLGGTDDGQIYGRLAGWALRKNLWAACRDFANNAIAQMPDCAELHYIRAQAEKGLGAAQEAVVDEREAEKLENNGVTLLGSFAKAPDYTKYLEEISVPMHANWHPEKSNTSFKVVLKLQIHWDGRISDVTLVESSNNREEDEAAVKAALSAKLPPLPRFAMPPIWTQFTYAYKIRDSKPK